MFEVMSRHYEQIKDNLGLDEALAPSSEDEKDNYIGKWGYSKKLKLLFIAMI